MVVLRSAALNHALKPSPALALRLPVPAVASCFTLRCPRRLPTCSAAPKSTSCCATVGRATTRRPPHPALPPSPRTQISSASPWWSVIVIVLVAGVYTCYPSSPRLEQSAPPPGTIPRHQLTAHIVMALDNPEGRPGNLTKLQEERLQELWLAAMHVFGVLDESKPEESNGTATPNGTTEKKKKRLGVFSRKKKSDNADASSADDDKYGQNKVFEETLASQSPALLRATFWSMVKHDNPDALLLRFLRARKWDVDKALVMMISTMSWRATEVHVDDDIMTVGEAGAMADSKSTDKTKKRLGEDFLAQMRIGKSFVHGLDDLGRPMCVVRARLHRQGEQSEEALNRYTVFVIETTRLMLAPPVDTACVVFDMTGFSLANMDYTPVKFMIKVFEANYPESLGVVLIHKAPWVFQGIWKIVRGWLDPVVASKVNFTNSVEDIEQYVGKDRIMKALGGDEDWEYEFFEPKDDENPKMKDTATRDKLLAEREEEVKEYEKETLAWARPESSANLAEIKARRDALAEKLRVGYWNLDPYIRARSYYDRIGLINHGGEINFYPKEKPVEVAAPAPQPATAPAADTATPPVETNDDDVD